MARRKSLAVSTALSATATPEGSTYTSTYTSEVATEDDVNKIPIGSLSLKSPGGTPRRAGRVPSTPLPFLLLPSELRLKIYAYYFDDTDGEVLDLAPDLYKRLHKRLGLMRVCRLIHEEATHYFYSTRTFRIFPTCPGRYFKTKKPLLARMKPAVRECLTSLELRLGPGWNAPPRGWVVNDPLGLKDCKNVRRLNVFVEFDPSDASFKEFRRSDGFYEGFSQALLINVLKDMPSVEAIDFDAWSGVKKAGGMMRTLLHVATEAELGIGWGPKRGWTDAAEEEHRVERDSASPFIDGIPIQGYASQNILVVA